MKRTYEDDQGLCMGTADKAMWEVCRILLSQRGCLCGTRFTNSSACKSIRRLT